MWTLDDIREQAKADPRFLAVLRVRMERSFLDFVLVMFPLVYNLPFSLSKHHVVLCQTLERVYKKDILRLLINIPPGYGKTELVIVMFSAWCLAKEPRARFMHTSYSDDLALDNSSKVKDILTSEVFQMLWPLTIRGDSQAKKRWVIEGFGGTFIAAPMEGQITGRRAGVLGLKDIFSGALIVDDPMKPEDGHSVLKRTKINRRFKSTIRNRVATESVPVIIIMQRLHKSDLCGFLLEGGTGEKWHHLNIPVEINESGVQPTEYKDSWKYGVPIKYKMNEGPLWFVKHNQNDLDMLRKSDMFVWMAQYMQNPSSPEMSTFNETWWQFYESYNEAEGYITLLDGSKKYLHSKTIYADTAMKTGEANDFSVLQAWAKFVEGKAIALLDQDRGKWEAPDLEQHMVDFIRKHAYKPGEVAIGLRGVKVEDKASGTGLIQSINRRNDVQTHITGIQRDRDKVSRGNDTAPSVKRGEVYLPANAVFLGKYLEEMTEFNEFMTHDYDDQVDVTMDAVQDLLINDFGGYEGFV